MTQSLLSKTLSRPLKIGSQCIPKRIVLAPMAGLGHIAMRHLIAEFGGFGLLFTGMCSAKAVPHENPDVSLVFSWRSAELPFVVCQIFGSDPSVMARAAQRIEKEGFFGVDLNFGCSVSAICKKGCGAALLKNPELSRNIVAKVREAVSIPVFVKFRTGWRNDPCFAAEMAKQFEDAGADALTFHPRVAPDRRNRPPQWNVIKDVCDAVDIPVFGNGNLFEPTDGQKMLAQSDCQGLSIGRMAIAQPWLFAQWTDNFTVTEDIYFKTALRYTQLLSEYFEDYFAVKFFKKFLPYFCANFKFGNQILKKLMRVQSMTDAPDYLKAVFDIGPETVSRPNQHLFTR